MEILSYVHPLVYIGVIAALLVTILLLLFRGRKPKGSTPNVMEMMERQYKKNLAQTKAAGESALSSEKQNTLNALSEMEKQKEIAGIAASISNEQAKKLVFFTDLATEFHPPLFQIMNSLENILLGVHGRIQGKLKDELKTTLLSARQLLRFMNQFHDISRLQTGKMELKVSRIDIVQLARAVVETITWYALENGIELLVVAPQAKVEAYCDREKIGEVLYHLLSNAFKFTPRSGRIEIRIDDSLDRPDADEFFRLSVRNTGDPIPEDRIPYIFDIFQTTSQDRQKPRLGLSLVKELVSLHGGEITVRSEAEIGTEFSITLPKSRVAHMAQEEGVEARTIDLSQRAKIELAVLESIDDSPKQKQRQAEPVRAPREIAHSVLVVEDNEDVRQLLRSALQDFFQVHEAANGKDALKAASEYHPDLIITDIMMPEMNGLDFCKKIKSDEALQNIPIILLTARTEPGTREEGMEAGASAYISKPFRFEELLKQAKSLIGARNEAETVN